MNLLNVIRGFDTELYDYYEEELERQYYSLSFIPDENSMSPLCAATLGNVLVNEEHNNTFSSTNILEEIVTKRICSIFNCEHANVKCITIEAASRVVLQALVQRGDVVMSLDLRKKEHCNSESFVYRFVNFGLNPETQHLNYDAIEAQAQENKPRLIIVSPINYPYPIDYERLSKIATDVGAILWCDISQVAGLITSGVMASPLPYADVVTFTTHGALQGPRSAVIISKYKYASAIDRVAFASGHTGLGSPELAAMAIRLKKMQSPEYRDYCDQAIKNAQALAEGLKEGGMTLICGGTESHLVVIDAKHCAMSARGAIDSLADCGILARNCKVYTEDPAVKFDAVRFSSLPATTREIKPEDMKKLGVAIAHFLGNPNTEHEEKLHDLVRNITILLPLFSSRWLTPIEQENLANQLAFLGRSDSTTASKHRLGRFMRNVLRKGKDEDASE